MSLMYYDYASIDIDIKYKDFIKDYIKEYVNKLILVNVKGYKIKDIKIRKSASGNVHIMINFENQYDILTIMMIRAFLSDDAFRIRSDLRKLFNEQYREFMILWDGKIEIQNGKRENKKAGKWHDFIKLYEKQMRKIDK